MSGQTFPDVRHRIFKTQLDQSRMSKHCEHDRTQRTQLQLVAGVQGGRWRPVFGRRPKVSGAEHDGGEPSHVTGAQRIASCEPHFHGATGRQMYAGQARGQRRRVVGDDDVVRADERRKIGARTVRDRPSLIDDEQPPVRRPLRWPCWLESLNDLALPRDERNRRPAHSRGDQIRNLAGRGVRTLQRRAIGIGDGERVQRSVHIPGIDGDDPNAF